jgi:hypothetical protein
VVAGEGGGGFAASGWGVQEGLRGGGGFREDDLGIYLLKLIRCQKLIIWLNELFGNNRINEKG